MTLCDVCGKITNFVTRANEPWQVHMHPEGDDTYEISFLVCAQCVHDLIEKLREGQKQTQGRVERAVALP